MLRVAKKMLVLTGEKEEDISFWSESEWRKSHWDEKLDQVNASNVLRTLI
jgi:hypothetical protein